MKKIKFYVFFYGIILGLAAVGASLGIILVRLSEKYPNFFNIGFLDTCGIIVFAFVFTNLLHELVHAGVYKLNGVGTRMFYIFPLCFVKEQDRVKIHITVNPMIGLGGIVIPEIPCIHNSEMLEKMKKAMSRSLVLAPISSAIWGVFSLGILVCVLKNVVYQWQAPIFFFFMTSFISGIYINICSLFFFGGVIGDYVAGKMIKENESFFMIQLFNFVSIQNTSIKKYFREDSDYFYGVVENYVYDKWQADKKACESRDFIYFVDYLMYEDLLYQQTNGKLELILVHITEQMNEVKEKLKWEIYGQFFCHLVIYLYLNGEQAKAAELWKLNKAELPCNNVAKYHSNQVEAILNGETSYDFYSKKDIHIASSDCVLNKMENYYEDEMVLNQRIMQMLL